MKDRGKTVEIHGEYQTGPANEDFWKEVATGVNLPRDLQSRSNQYMLVDAPTPSKSDQHRTGKNPIVAIAPVF